VKADRLIQKGDWFHLRPHRVGYELLNDALDMVDEAPCPVHTIPGNHDLPDGSMESLDRTPFKVILRHSKVHLLDRLLVPTDGAFELLFIGFPKLYDVTSEEIRSYVEQVVRSVDQTKSSAKVLVCHLPIMPPDVSQPYDYISAVDVAAALKGMVNVVSYGHVHDNHGIYNVGGVAFVNVGAVSRDSVHEYNLTRQPAVVLGAFDSSAGKLAFREMILPHAPVEEAYDLEKLKEDKADAKAFESFMLAVGSSELEEITLEGLKAMIHAMDVGPPVKSKAVEFLERVSW